MAIPEPRLFELATLLAEVGADWLGVEVLDGVRSGLALEEPGPSLSRAQISARYGLRAEIDNERTRAFPRPRELHGDEQIAWAATYVIQRLTDEAEMLAASLEALDRLGRSGELDVERRRQERQMNPIVALQVGEEGPVIAGIDTTKLLVDLAALKVALDRWVKTATDRQ